MAEGQELSHFYRKLFSERIACVVLGALGSLNGRFDCWQREFAFGWGDGRWNRSQVCYDWREALQLLRREGTNAINFGGVFSLQPPPTPMALKPYDLAASRLEPTGPRDWERKRVWASGCGTPAGGELVIDVDLDDRTADLYNRVGICGCAGHKRVVCAVCWNTFMNPAQMAIETLLVHWGISKYIAYFSGRRGVHYMLLDDWIVALTNEERARFMDVFAAVPTEHSVLGRAMYDLLAPFVESNPVLKARCETRVRDHRPRYQDVMRELYPKMDKPVGADASHLHGVPLTLHPDTRVLRILIGSAFDERTRFSYEKHRFDVDRLTRDTTNILWACALRILKVLMGPHATMSPQQWVEHALSQGGHATTKSEVLK